MNLPPHSTHSIAQRTLRPITCQTFPHFVSLTLTYLNFHFLSPFPVRNLYSKFWQLCSRKCARKDEKVHRSERIAWPHWIHVTAILQPSESLQFDFQNRISINARGNQARLSQTDGKYAHLSVWTRDVDVHDIFTHLILSHPSHFPSIYSLRRTYRYHTFHSLLGNIFLKTFIISPPSCHLLMDIIPLYPFCFTLTLIVPPPIVVCGRCALFLQQLLYFTTLRFFLQINETYQKPSKWVDLILSPSISRYDARHFVISYIIKHLEHSSVYELMVQAKNKFGWNEVRLKGWSARRYKMMMNRTERIFERARIRFVSEAANMWGMISLRVHGMCTYEKVQSWNFPNN